MSKITSIEILMVDLTPKVKRTDAVQAFVSQETPIVKITDEDGITGIGYSYTIGTGGKAIMSLLRETLVPQLVGRDAEQIEAIWRDLLFSTHATAVGAITSLALAAIDIALWDLRGKKYQLPLWKLAGGAKQNIPLYSTEGGWLHLSVDDLISEALAVQKKGFTGAKIKIGKPNVQEDFERLSAVRQAVGEHFLIMVDANQSMNLAEAMRRADKLAPLNLYWLEEPMPANDVGAHQKLAQYSRIPIAVGESIYSISHFKDYLTQGACSVVQADVARVGGITPWLKIAHMAEAFNTPICPHFLMEIHISLTCAVPNSVTLEYIPQLDSITNNQLEIVNGIATPPGDAGIGIDWDWQTINKQIIADTNFKFGKE